MITVEDMPINTCRGRPASTSGSRRWGRSASTRRARSANTIWRAKRSRSAGSPSRSAFSTGISANPERGDQPGGLQSLGRRSGDGRRWRDLFLGSVAAGAIEPGLASSAGTLRHHQYARDRRGRLLQSGRVQRRPCLGDEGDVRPSRVAHHPRPPPWRQTQQGVQGRVALSVAGRICFEGTRSRSIRIWRSRAQSARCSICSRERARRSRVVRRFNELGLRFPRRSYGGAWDGKLVWGRLTHSRVLGILANPSYAGVYIFGRYQSRKQVAPSGEIRTRSRS